MNQLKPTTGYHFSEADLKFVLELAKVGSVHLLSSQVSLTSRKESSTLNLTFKDYGGTEGKSCDGLKLPDNWVIENIYSSGDVLSVLFGVKKD